jgi:hypothetical protein
MPPTEKELARRAAAERMAEIIRLAAIEWRAHGYVERTKAIFTREREPRDLDSMLEELQELVDELIARGELNWAALEAQPGWQAFLRQFEWANGYLGWCEGEPDYTERHAREWIPPLRTAVVVGRMKDGADPVAARCLSRPVSPSPPLSPQPSSRRSSTLSSGPLSPALALPRRLSSADLWGDGEWTGYTAPLHLPSPPLPEDEPRPRTQSHSLPSSRRCSVLVPKEI